MSAALIMNYSHSHYVITHAKQKGASIIAVAFSPNCKSDKSTSSSLRVWVFLCGIERFCAETGGSPFAVHAIIILLTRRANWGWIWAKTLSAHPDVGRDKEKVKRRHACRCNSDGGGIFAIICGSVVFFLRTRWVWHREKMPHKMNIL